MTKALPRVQRCQFCGKTFTRENWFLKHTCAKKRKFEDQNDFTTQRGYRLFVYWMKCQNLIRANRKPPTMEKFVEGSYKKAFTKLAQFCQDQNIISAYTYVDWLLKTKTPERDWCSDSTIHLDRFKVYINQHEDPTDQAKHTLNEIRKWVLEKEERTGAAFFEMLTPGRIFNLVQQRKIKPWVLFAYQPVVLQWLDEDTYDAEVFHKINDMLNCSYWSDKLSTMPEAEDIVTAIMDEALTWD